MIDLHNHSFFSPDSSEDTETMIVSAINKGALYFGISEHMDYEQTEKGVVCDTDFAKYIQYATALKKKYEKQINFLVGVELGYAKFVDIEKYKTISQNSNVDYVINSVHAINGVDCYYGESFRGYAQRERYFEYLECVLQSVELDYDYQIIGHLGYVSRNAPYDNPCMNYSNYSEIIDKILLTIIKRDKTIELNTSTCTCGETYLPNDTILKRYFELGGRNVTFGSDSHSAARIGDKYKIVVENLKKIGYEYLVAYKRKEIIYVPI